MPMKLPLIVEAETLVGPDEDVADVTSGRSPNLSVGKAARGLKLLDLRSAEAFSTAHIPGALRIDTSLLNRVAPPHAGLLPDDAGINALVHAADLREGEHIVALDAGGETAAARLIWVLQAWGFTNTSWLNGGMKAWLAAGGPAEPLQAVQPSFEHSEVVDSRPLFTPRFVGSNCVSADELATQLNDTQLRVLDVRGSAEYAGTDIRSAEGGHVPGAKHLEWTQQLDSDGRVRPAADLNRQLADIDVLPDHRVVAYCQSHQRSAVTWLILRSLGYQDVRGLDGAWSVWGNRPDLPKDV